MNDLISRQEAIDALRTHGRKASKKWFDNQLDIEWNNAIDICCYDIEDLPSAQPERKRGKWIDYVNSHCECSVCHTEWSYFQNETECFEFCPNCGADMREADDERPD